MYMDTSINTDGLHSQTSTQDWNHSVFRVRSEVALFSNLSYSRGVASFQEFPGTGSDCPHANYLARNASPSLWTLYYTFAFEKLCTTDIHVSS